MRRTLLALLAVLLAASAGAQQYDSTGRLKTNSRISNGTSFVVPALDTTLTARFPAGSTPADAESNAVTISRIGAFMYVFNGLTWDRWTGAAGGGPILDGAAPAIKATVLDYVNSNPLAVRLTDTNGDYVGAGGGTQYTTGNAVASPIGTAALGWDGANVRVLRTDTSGYLHSNLYAVGGTAVSGANVVDAGNTAFRVNCVAGCIPGGSFTDNSAFTGGATSASPVAALYDTTPPAIGDGNAGAFRMNSSRILYADLSLTAANSTALKVDGSAVTQPVSGTVTANISGSISNTDFGVTGDVAVVNSATGGKTQLDVKSTSGIAQLPAALGANGALKVEGVAGGTAVPVSGTFWPTVANVNPAAVRLSDGAAWYDATKTGQLPAALDGSGYLKTHEQGTAGVNVAQVGGTNLSGANVVDAGNTAFRVNCITGCGATTFTDNNAFTGGSTAITPVGAIYDTTPPAVADGSAGAFRMNANRILYADISLTGGNGNVAVINSATVGQTQLDIKSTTGISQLPSALDGSGYLKTHEQGTANVQWTGQTVTVSQSTPGSLKGTMDQGAAGAAAWPIEVNRWAGGSPLNGTGGSGAGVPRVTVANDSSTHITSPSEIGVYPEDSPETGGGNLMMAGSVRRNAAAASTAHDADNATINTDGNGLLWARTMDPCTALAKTPVPFSFNTAVTTQLVAASASNKVYICSLNLVTAGANQIALVEDDSAACASPGTNGAGMAGGTTAATGWNFAANGGIALGSGAGTVLQTANTNRYVCLISAQAVQVSGAITYVLAP